MPRIFLGNFDFEHDLAGQTRPLSRDAQGLAADLTAAWIAIAEPDDVIWSPTGLPRFGFRELQAAGISLPGFATTESGLPCGPDWELVPWGWTADCLRWGEAHGWLCPAPPIPVVSHVNRRSFRSMLERDLGIMLPGSACLGSEELEAHLARVGGTDTKWVIKADFGMSGRERFLGKGPYITDAARNWAKKRSDPHPPLGKGGPGGVSSLPANECVGTSHTKSLVFEPWLNAIEEAGLQWQIPQCGTPHLLGITPLLTDTSGTYRGSRVTCAAEDLAVWQPAVDATSRVVERLQALGYSGPAGIDAMRYRDDAGEIQIRPLQDLNARYTMGRLALGLRRLVPAGWLGDWLHDSHLVDAVKMAEPECRVLQITARSWLVMRRDIASSPAALEQPGC